jgi:hypothetical protein
MIVLQHTIASIRFEERITMRTTKTLQQSVAYQNGTPAYSGDVERQYTSGIFLSLQVHVVRAPQGAKVENWADDELKQTIKRLKPGQIGALKEVQEEKILSSEPFFEMIIPTDRDSTIAVASSCRDLVKAATITDGMTCTINKKRLPVETVKELLVPHRDSNREIQQKWIEFNRTDRAKLLSSVSKLEQKIRFYSDYFSVSEYTLVVSGQIRHIVNNPALSSTVYGNVDQLYYNSVDYTMGNTQVHKIASERLPMVSIPIVTKGDYKRSLQILEDLKGKSDAFKRLVAFGGEEVFHEGGIFGNTHIKWNELRARDTNARLAVVNN